jgi:hypothetical protein
MTDGAKHSVIDFVGTCGTRVSFRLACPIAHVLLYGNLVRNDSDIALLERSYEWSVSTNLEKALSSSKLSQRNPWYGTPITINEPEIRKAVGLRMGILPMVWCASSDAKRWTRIEIYTRHSDPRIRGKMALELGKMAVRGF